MSDIDRTRMIPLHIADQAVAACDAEIAKLREENARLKAEVGELADALKLASEVGIKIADEVTRLKAEIERLRASSFVTAVPVEQYERLVKAGDAMANNIPYYADVDISAETLREFTDKWNAAKEGKPHA